MNNSGVRSSLNGGMNDGYDRRSQNFNKSIPVRSGRKNKPSNEFAKKGLPVPFTGMRNHHLSEKKLGMVDKNRTYYEKSSAWANKGNANRTVGSGTANTFYP